MRRQEPVVRLVGPEDPDHVASPVVQGDEQPVVVPRPRPAPVQLRHVQPPAEGDAAFRLGVRHEIAAFDLERRVEQPFDLGKEDLAGPSDLLEPPADCGARLEARGLRIAQRREHVFESQCVTNAGADRAQDLVHARLGREA